MNRPGPVVLYFSIVFASGIGVGAFSHRLYSAKVVVAKEEAKEDPAPRRSSEDFRRRYLEELRSRVHTSDDQIQKIDAIMDATRLRFREVSTRFEPEFKAIRQQQIDQIKALLSAEQKIEFDKFQADRERERELNRKRRGKNGSPGPGC